MNVIRTTAPIKIEELKKYFADKQTYYIIDYEKSELKGAKLLTYLSNLDIPSDIHLRVTSPEFAELLVEYLKTPFLLNLPSLEKEAILMLLEFKGVKKFGYERFIEENFELVSNWGLILDSLLLFNTYTVDQDNCRESVKNDFPKFPADFLIGANFVSLLKYPDFYDFYSTVEKDNMRYHEQYFNNYMFKGRNLYNFWANAANPIFLMTWGALNGEFNEEEFIKAVKTDIEELNRVSFI